MSIILQLFSIFGKIDLKGVDEANRDLDKLDGKGKSTAGKIGSFAKKVGKGAAIIGGAAVAAGGAAFAMTQKVTGSFDDIAKSSRKLGITSDAYQELDYWAGQNGISHEQMEKVVGRFNQRMGQAQNGNEKYANALKELGVNMDDVRNGTLSTEDAFEQSIKTLTEMENEQDKVNLATEMFGVRVARDMLPALQDGSLSIEDAKEKAKELGFVIEEDTLSAAEHFNDTWDDLTRMLGAFGQRIIAKLMPAFQTLMDWVIDNLPLIQSAFDTAFNVISDVISNAVEWIQSLISWLGEWFSTNEEGLSSTWEAFQEYLTLIKDYVQEVLEFIKEIITEAFSIIGPFIQEQLEKILLFYQENGQQIVEAVRNVFEFIKAIIELIMPVVLFIVQDVWNSIKDVIGGVLDIILGLIKTFASLFTGDWSGMWEGIKQVLGGAVQALWGLINLWFIGKILKLGKAFAKGFANIFKNLWNGVKSLFSSSVNFVKNIVQTGFNAMKSVVSSIMNGIKSVISSIWSAIKGVVSRTVNSIKTTVSSVFNSVKSTVTTVWNGIKTAITKPINAAKDTVKKALDAIKGFFDGLKLKFPDIKPPKLPKFSLKGKFSLRPPSVPKVGIKWNAEGGIFRKPTIFNTANAGLQGVGEAGPEAILPLNSNTLGSIGASIAKTMPKQDVITDNSGTNELINIISKQNEILMGVLVAVKEGKEIKLNNRVLNEEIDNEQGKRIGLNGRRVAY